MEAWLSMSASDLGRGIEAGEIDPSDLAEAFLSAIANHEFGPRIYARTTADRARAEAAAASERARHGLRRSLLDGVPISWKDLFDTAGVATESGSALLKGRVPGADAAVLRKATATGLVCLGKTHMSELAFSGLGLNPVTESPPCINDHDAVAGGSSSGAATSVAFGLAPAGIGSDTGGSVRVPPAWNDLVGLKTTAGRLSLEGVVPLAPSFDTVGPICRTVEDAARLLAALEGGKVADLAGADLRGQRFLVLEDPALEMVRDSPRQGFEDAVDRLAKSGAVIERGTVPAAGEALSMSAVLFTSEAYGTWKDAIEAHPELMFDLVRERFRSGRDHLASDYVAGWQRLKTLRARYLAATAGYDAVLLPTCPNLPPKQADLARDSALFVSENLLALRNTRVGNLMGLCGLTLPTDVPSAGLMLLAPPMAEERLLRIGAAVETALA